jgi:ubiquinone/menaquinone biosynthesis C-methylase UbiE
MFTKSAEWYDAIYAWKNYKREADSLHALIQQHARRHAATLLDVACGTGQHLPYLTTHYAIEGLDLDEKMLAIARQKNPDVVFHHADLAEFDLGRQFDVVVCLFSSIAYAKSYPRLEQALRSMTRHARSGGLVAVEPFIRPEKFTPGHVAAIFVDRPDLKIARINVGTVEDGAAVLLFHYLVGTPQGVEYFTERHELALFSHEEYLAAFRAAGLEVVYDEEGLMGRGLYIGILIGGAMR